MARISRRGNLCTCRWWAASWPMARSWLFPPRIYELTQTMLSHAVRGELDDLAAVIRADHPEMRVLGAAAGIGG